VSYVEVLGDQSTMYIKVTLYGGVLDCIVTISFGYMVYCGCFDLFCNVWVFW